MASGGGTNRRFCSSCGASNEGNELLECTGCRIALYCDRNCQKSQWKQHKPTCKLAQRFPPRSTTTVDLNGESEIKNFDSILEYAATHLTNLEHLSIWIPQDAVLDSDSFSSFGDGYRTHPTIQLSAHVLRSFLARRKLKSFVIGWEDCCWDATRKMTDSGRAFQPLGDNEVLETLRITSGVFDSAQDLTSCLPLTLKTLELPDLVFGNDVYTWALESTEQLVEAVSGLVNLVCLRFTDCHFEDHHLERLLSNLPHLRALWLAGQFGVHAFGRTGSHITDTGFGIIARCCPRLQILDMSYQEKVTVTGAAAILEECQEIREFYISNENVSIPDIESLARVSNTLLVFGRFRGGGTAESEVFRGATLASGGRTLFVTDFDGLVQVSGLSSSVLKKATESRRILDKVQEKRGDPLIHNVWKDVHFT